MKLTIDELVSLIMYAAEHYLNAEQGEWWQSYWIDRIAEYLKAIRAEQDVMGVSDASE